MRQSFAGYARRIDTMTNQVESKKYNGWTNYETWAVKLWLDNDQATYNTVLGLAKLAKKTPKNKVWTRKETTRFALADAIKNYVANDIMPDLEASLASDLLNAALSEVNWQEIADNVLSDN
jgi:hypothetical protein